MVLGPESIYTPDANIGSGQNMTVYDIPERNFSWLEEKVGKLNKKAERLGVQPIVLRIVGEIVKPFLVSRRDGQERLTPVQNPPAPESGIAWVGLKFLQVDVSGEAPVLAGWKFVGTIQHVHENGDSATILRSVPGLTIPDEYRDSTPEWCDHCQLTRRRNDTFVVQNVTSGEHKRVGRNCLKDFLGHPDPEGYASWAESLGLLHDLAMAAAHEYAGGSVFDRFFPTDVVMVVAAEAIARHGWVSGKMAREAEEREDFPLPVRTRDRVSAWFMHAGFEITKASTELAAQALEWARTELVRIVQFQKRDSDYLYNLKEVAKLDALNYRMLGIAVSLIPTYQREIGKRVEQVSNSTHFGEPGVRLTTILKVIDKRPIQLSSGEPLTLLRFETAEGDIAVWFTKSSPMQVGRTYRVKATVKRHDTYKGVAQTVLGRINIMEEVQ